MSTSVAKDIELIEKYLDDLLSADEHKRVEERLSSDQSFIQLFRWQKDVRESVAKKERLRLKSILKMEDLRTSKRAKYLRWLFIALGLLTIILTLWLLLRSKHISDNEIYASNFSPYPWTLDPPVRSLQDAKSLAWMVYQNPDTSIATTTYDLLIPKSKDSLELRFLYANVLLQREDFDAAIDQLQRLKNYKPNRTNLYLGLAYLGSGQREEAIRVLKLIGENDQDNSSKRNNILRQLQR